VTTPPLPDQDELVAALTESFAAALRSSLGAPEALTVATTIATGAPLPDTLHSTDRPLVTLVAFDADRIQSWVFASERVQVAAGASATLDHLNQQVDELVGGVEGVSGVVYSAGGGGLLVGPATDSPTELARRVGARLEERSRGLSFTVHAIAARAADLAPSTAPTRLTGSPLASRFEIAHGVAGTLARLQAEVRRRKDEALPPMGPALRRRGGLVAERCPSCGLRPPGRSPVTDDGPAFWCGRCRDLRESWKRGPGRSFEHEDRPLTFEDLAAASLRGRSFLGFVALDGNAMGGLFRRVTTFLQLRALSEATTRVYAAARSRVPDLLDQGSFLAPDWPADEAFLSLLSGGDEITLVLPASAAPSIAGDVLRAVETGFDEAASGDGLLATVFAADPALLDLVRRAGAAAGVVVAQGTYPVRLLRRYAYALQSGAKARCAEKGLRSAVAWHLLTDSSPLTRDLAAGDRADSSLSAFDRLLGEVAAAQAARVPRSALQQLLAELRREEDGLFSVDAAERRDVLARCGANFLRYQVARNPALATWWQQVGPTWQEEPEEARDGALPFMLRAADGRLQRFLDLLSLDPVPAAPLSPSEETVP